MNGTNDVAAEAQLIKLSEVALLLRLNIRTVARMAREGELPAMRIGGVWRVKRTSLNEWMREREKLQEQANDGAKE